MTNLPEQVELICSVLYEKKGSDILAIHVTEKTIIADWFVICTGRAVPQVKALCDELEEKCSEQGMQVRRRDGYEAGRWIVTDFGDILVHIFHPEERQFYNIERLWCSDNLVVRYSELKDAELEDNKPAE